MDRRWNPQRKNRGVILCDPDTATDAVGQNGVGLHLAHVPRHQPRLRFRGVPWRGCATSHHDCLEGWRRDNPVLLGAKAGSSGARFALRSRCHGARETQNRCGETAIGCSALTSIYQKVPWCPIRGTCVTDHADNLRFGFAHKRLKRSLLWKIDLIIAKHVVDDLKQRREGTLDNDKISNTIVC